MAFAAVANGYQRFDGLSSDVMRQALAQAKKGRMPYS